MSDILFRHYFTFICSLPKPKDSKKSKKFKLYSNDTLDKLREGYKKYYKKRGCRSVEFYLHGAKLNKKSTVESLGLREMDVIVAMENGKKLNISR
mmetsp:Transcript_52018/g.156117  ORF Transcript_52018/g.156117 Transcript_52018/m.156117 type:complete len:95 (-) Transcript_52018:125-409(-)